VLHFLSDTWNQKYLFRGGLIEVDVHEHLAVEIGPLLLVERLSEQ
jgi:hypothetical protein